MTRAAAMKPLPKIEYSEKEVIAIIDAWIDIQIERARSQGLEKYKNLIFAFDNDGTITPHCYLRLQEFLDGKKNNLDFFQLVLHRIKNKTKAKAKTAIVSMNFVTEDEARQEVRYTARHRKKGIPDNMMSDLQSEKPYFCLENVYGGTKNLNGIVGRQNIPGSRNLVSKSEGIRQTFPKSNFVIVVDDDVEGIRESYCRPGFVVINGMHPGSIDYVAGVDTELGSIFDAIRKWDYKRDPREDSSLERSQQENAEFGFCLSSVLLFLIVCEKIPKVIIDKFSYIDKWQDKLSNALSGQLGIDNPLRQISFTDEELELVNSAVGSRRSSAAGRFMSSMRKVVGKKSSSKRKEGYVAPSLRATGDDPVEYVILEETEPQSLKEALGDKKFSKVASFFNALLIDRTNVDFQKFIYDKEIGSDFSFFRGIIGFLEGDFQDDILNDMTLNAERKGVNVDGLKKFALKELKILRKVCVFFNEINSRGDDFGLNNLVLDDNGDFDQDFAERLFDLLEGRRKDEFLNENFIVSLQPEDKHRIVNILTNIIREFGDNFLDAFDTNILADNISDLGDEDEFLDALDTRSGLQHSESQSLLMTPQASAFRDS